MLIFNYMYIGKNIRALRKKEGLTQVALAKKLKIKQQMITDYERGRTNPEVSKLPDLAKALNVTIQDLFMEETVNDQAEPAKIVRKNSREFQASETFKKLSAEEQRTVLKQMKALERAKKLKVA